MVGCFGSWAEEFVVDPFVDQVDGVGVGCVGVDGIVVDEELGELVNSELSAFDLAPEVGSGGVEGDEVGEVYLFDAFAYDGGLAHDVA